MKKKPIYLWVLLVLSALISASSLFGILGPVPSKEVLRASLANSGTLTTQQIEDTVNYTYKVSESSHSIFNVLLIVLSAILVVVAFVFLIRKNVQFANYAYIGYVLVAIVGLVYSFMNIQDAVQLIKRETNSTFAELLNKQRIKAAQQLLLSTSDSIEDICYAVGYSNVGYFYKVFRKLCGKSPKAYRKQVETSL